MSRYNDDFRFSCATWSEVTRAIEVLSEEARVLDLTVNDLKTVTWGRKKYEEHLDEAEQLRLQIADEAELDLTYFDIDPYDDNVVFEQQPDPEEVDLLGSIRVLERWSSVVRRGHVPMSRRAEHRAVMQLLPQAFRTLQAHPHTPAVVLSTCTAPTP